VELDIFVAVVPQNYFSEVQREVCVKEAEKLAGVIRRSNPRFQSELSLSILTTAWTVHVPTKSLTCRQLPLKKLIGVLVIFYFAFHAT